MRVYIATSLAAAGRAEVLAHAFFEAGHQVTYAWFRHGGQGHLGRERLREVADAELAGVAEADLVVVVLVGDRQRGTHTELGYALALGKPVVIWDQVGGAFAADDTTCAFYHHPLIYQAGGDLAEAHQRGVLVAVSQGWLDHHQGRAGMWGHGHRVLDLLRVGG